MLEISAIDLENWARTYEAPFEFPRLVRRLIWASCDGIRKLDMPGGEHVHLHGFDGIVECASGNAFVPDGTSGWEPATEKEVTSKANKDYIKRTNPSGAEINRKDTSFVFATPCRWPAFRKWQSDRTNEGKWKQVRGLASSDFEAWLDTVPWIAASMSARIFGRKSLEVRTTEAIWSEYADVPHPANEPLGPGFVLAGREALRQDLLGWLQGTTAGKDQIIRFSGPSEREILHFVAAAIHSLGNRPAEKLGATVFAVYDAEAAKLLRGVKAHHTILVKGEIAPHIMPIRRASGCRLVLYHADDRSPAVAPLPVIGSFELTPRRRDVIVRQLVGIGYEPGDAARICQECSCDYDSIRKAAFLC